MFSVNKCLCMYSCIYVQIYIHCTSILVYLLYPVVDPGFPIGEPCVSVTHGQ